MKARDTDNAAINDWVGRRGYFTKPIASVVVAFFSGQQPKSDRVIRFDFRVKHNDMGPFGIDFVNFEAGEAISIGSGPGLVLSEGTPRFIKMPSGLPKREGFVQWASRHLNLHIKSAYPGFHAVPLGQLRENAPWPPGTSVWLIPSDNQSVLAVPYDQADRFLGPGPLALGIHTNSIRLISVSQDNMPKRWFIDPGARATEIAIDRFGQAPPGRTAINSLGARISAVSCDSIGLASISEHSGKFMARSPDWIDLSTVSKAMMGTRPVGWLPDYAADSQEKKAGRDKVLSEIRAALFSSGSEHPITFAVIESALKSRRFASRTPMRRRFRG